MRVVIFHNAVSADDSAADQDVLVQAAAVAEALSHLGHSSTQVACTLDLSAARAQLAAGRPDVVFNLVESLGGSDWMAVAAAAFLDTMGLPYTGSPTEVLLLTNHKLLAKQRLSHAGLPTPEWEAVDTRRAAGANFRSLRDFGSFGDPSYVIKTLWEHASFDLDEHSIVRPADEAELRDLLCESARRVRRPCYAERYIEGREFNLSVLAGPNGPQALPPAEIDFSAFPPGRHRIVGRKAKWDEGSFDFQNTPRRFDFPPADAPLLDRLSAMARDAWHAFGLGGYARVDFRVDAEEQPWILEINANPCLSPDAGFVAALDRTSIPFDQAVERILSDALR
jgi:D-alanine-D-alanine ligase